MTDIVMNDDVVMTFGEFRRMFRLCPKGHRMGSTSKHSCWTCKRDERKKNCPHTGNRHYSNPSNLPGENRYMCVACGQTGLPAQPLIQHIEGRNYD